MLIQQLIKFNEMGMGNKIALEMGDRKITYEELDTLSNKIAQFLKASKISSGDIVGISMKRSPEMIATIIGILKSGAAYLPLDPEYPQDRLHFMIKHSRAKKVIINKSLEKIYSSIDKSIKSNFEDIEFEKYPNTNLIIDDRSDNLCYVIYTSGSTGTPKGVAMGHGPLVNLIQWQNIETRLLEKSITLQFTPISFDVHFQEIFSTLSLGGKLVLISEEERLNTIELLKILNEKKVNRLYLPFVALNHIAEIASENKIYPASLREITTAGEQLKITNELRSMLQNIPECSLFNHYGPSETHVVTSLKLTGDSKNWPNLPSIGSEIKNCKIELLDSDKKAVKMGEVGELFISGKVLAHGYLHAPELTQERFFKINDTLYYKTGDLGIRNPDHSITFLGRSDSQVKIRGYRIEPSEIEIAITDILKINNAFVKVITESGIDPYLCAYFLISDAVDLNILKFELRKKLPEYMIPRSFLELEKIPLTPSGKVDYKNLPNPKLVRPELMNEYIIPTTDLEIAISKIWNKYLKIAEIGIKDSFFDLGGNSLLAIKVLIELNQKHDLNLTIAHLFQYPTIESLVDFIENAENSNDFESFENERSENHEIAIIGLSGLFPGAENLDAFWKMLLESKTGIKKFNKQDVNEFISDELKNDPNYVFSSGEFPSKESFDYKFFGMNPRESELMDPQQRKFLELSYWALENAGYGPNRFKGRIGVFAGMGNSKYTDLINENQDLVDTVGEFNTMLGLEKDYIGTRVSYKLNLKGPALSIHTGCSTSLVAIIEAVKNLRLGNCDIALAGGISISGRPNAGHLYQEGGILSKDGNCTPFDKNSSGTIFTDGGGVIVLKRLDRAILDNDKIEAVISGVGVNNDGADKMSFTAPSVNGQSKVIIEAIKDAKISAEQIKMIETHGTATPVGDPIEVEALNLAFKKLKTNKQPHIVLTSLKSNVGHLTAAAGVGSVIKVILSLKNKIIPGVAGFKELNPLINNVDNFFSISSSATKFNVLENETCYAGVSSFGVGGTNAHLIMREHLPPKEELGKQDVHNTTSTHLFKLSAKNEDQLVAMKNELIQKLKCSNASDYEKISFTLDSGKDEYNFRSCLVLNVDDLESEKYFFSNQVIKKHKLAFIFPGQGSHYAKMGKTLYSKNIIFKDSFDSIVKYVNNELGEDITKIMWSENSEELLKDTYYSQPAIFCLEYALGKTLIHLGIRPDFFIGHSIGEFACAALGEVFSEVDAAKIVVKRAKLMKKCSGGKMLSVAADELTAKDFATRFNLDIAAINGNKSIVISGCLDSINQLKEYLDSIQVGSIELKTSHAFHSKMMIDVAKEYYDFLKNFKFNKSSIKIISTVDGQVVDIESPEYWADHIVKTVNFKSVIAQIVKSQDVAFLEVGSRSILSSFIKKDYPNKFITIETLGNNENDELEKLKFAIGKLWVYGISNTIPDIMFAKQDKKRVETILYPFVKNHVWLKSKKINKQQVNKVNKIKTVGVTMSNEKLKLLQNKLCEVFEKSSGINVQEYGVNTTFLEMGMDSLFLTQVSLQLKKDLEVTVGFRQLLENFDTIDSLANHLIDKVNPKYFPQVEVREIVQPQVVNTPVKEVAIESKPIMLNPQLVNNLSGSHVASSSIAEIVSKQLELMNQQLLLLNSQGISHLSSPVVNAPNIESKVASEVKTPSTSTQRGVDIKKSKDSFGAQAKIIVEKTANLDAVSLQKIKDFTNKYNQKTKSSKKFAQDNRVNHADPRVVTGFKPESKEVVYPIVIKKSYLQSLWDLDDNQYIDMTCGFGSNFFGNGNERIKKYVLKQIEEGIELGPQHPLVSEVSLLINELTGNERSAFCNTGSEAVLGAMRLARTVTGREKIIVFSGSYHGINDEVIIRGSKSKQSMPAAPGINFSAVSNMIVLDYGTDESLEYIRAHALEVAAVLVEPVQSRRSDFHPKEFLKEVREITLKAKTCLIFDEIITGFRIHPAGAQGYFGIRADLCTYGKIVGGGMPIGVVSGKAEYMDALDGGFWQYGDDSTPTVGVTYFAGTFVRHPLALAAAKGALEILKEGGVAKLTEINDRAQKFADEFNKILKVNQVPIKMDNFGSLMKPKWTSELPSGDLFFAALRLNGVHVYDGFPWFVNMAHTDRDLENVIEAIIKSVGMMQEIGVFPKMNSNAEMNLEINLDVFDAKGPPVVGARIGKDENGLPAWFIDNPDRPGEFLKLKGKK